MNVLYLKKLDKKVTLKQVKEIKPDIIVCLEYPYRLSKSMLDYPKYGCINAHYSLLPKYRGRHPIQWAMINGETEIGVTVHYMTEDMDAGDIILQNKIQINCNFRYNTVYTIAKNMAEALLGVAVQLIQQGIAPRTPQDHSQATFAPRRVPEDSYIDYIDIEYMTAKQIASFVNAMSYPMPNAFIYGNDGIRVYFTGAYIEEPTEGTKIRVPRI